MARASDAPFATLSCSFLSVRMSLLAVVPETLGRPFATGLELGAIAGFVLGNTRAIHKTEVE